MSTRAEPVDRLNQRSAELAALFAAIARTRMDGVPVLNPALQVEALGFECMAPPTDDASSPPCGLGVLITPWFMNLVMLPLQREDDLDAVGSKQVHTLAGRAFEFIGAHEPAIGSFAACSLFSPMFEFANQATARATAIAVLEMLRAQAEAPPNAAVAAATAPPARRSFLFGRSAARDARP